MTETPPEVTEKDLPSLDLVYPLAMESYRDITERMKTQDERIRHFMTVALTITAAVPVAFQLFGIKPNMVFLGMAGLMLMSCLALCITASAKNELMIISMSALFDDYLHIPEFQAKIALIKYAGEDQMKNSRYLAARHKLLVMAMISLAAGMSLLAVSGLAGS
ncbi:MAG: hypothetical protein FWG13_08500 [Leptospirales bacterium]|nr:hypothetical protein [Leptospirales bacterium]